MKEPMYRLEWGYNPETNEDYLTVDCSAFGWKSYADSEIPLHMLAKIKAAIDRTVGP